VKLVTVCQHLSLTQDELRQLMADVLGPVRHEGRFILVKEVCADCATDEVNRVQRQPTGEPGGLLG
jgi:hypothetical protein